MHKFLPDTPLRCSSSSLRIIGKWENIWFAAFASSTLLFFLTCLRVADAAVPPPASGSSEHPYFSLTKQTKHTDTRLPFFFPYILSFTPYFTGASKAFMRGQEHHISLNVWVLRMPSVILRAQLHISHALVLHFSHVCVFGDDRFHRCVNSERRPRANPIVGLFFRQLRSGNVSGQWTSEAGLPVPHRGSGAGVRCRWAVSLSVRRLLQTVQIWGKKNAVHSHSSQSIHYFIVLLWRFSKASPVPAWLEEGVSVWETGPLLFRSVFALMSLYTTGCSGYTPWFSC